MLINFSAAQLGVIAACLELDGTEYASTPEIDDMLQDIKDTVLLSLGSEFYDMWLNEFDIID